MRTVLQRVTSARVTVAGEVVGEIGEGLVALVGVTHDDGPEEIATTVRKIAQLRLLREGLAGLDARSRDIIKRRWLDADSKLTLQELADEYGVSAERIRQIEANALKKMKALFAA